MALGPLVSFQIGAEQVIEVAVRNTLDIEIYWCALDAQLRMADDVYFLLAYCEGLQGMVILFRFGREAFDATTRAKRIGELVDRKNAFAVQPRSFLLRQIGKEA